MRKFTLFTTIPAILLGIVLGVCSTLAFAVDNNGIFELEGNAVEDTTPPPDDWETLFDDYDLGTNDGGATTFTFIDDMNGQDDIFTKGRSKTPEDPEVWRMKYDPPPPDKDNITNAYAANYMVSGEQIVYFGADLYAANGDAELAFWFFQQDVGPDGTGGFYGNHENGDVYVAVKFSNGGKDAKVTVYEWDLDCDKAEKDLTIVGACAADNIKVRIPEAEALCQGIGGSACAITNSGDAVSPWDYTPKSGTSNVFPETTFFEGGINVNETFGANKCFASYMASTGASTSFTATAKDFALGAFDVCSVDVTKTCANDTKDDDTPELLEYNVRGCGINDGAAPINLTTLLNSVPKGQPNVDPNPTWWFPGNVDDGSGLRPFDPDPIDGDCNDEDLLKQAVDNGTLVTDLPNTDLLAGEALVYQFDEITTVNEVEDTVTLDAKGTGTPGAEIDDDWAEAKCPKIEFPAALNVTKQCAADLEEIDGKVVVVISVKGQVCNKGEVQLTELTLADNVDTPASGPVTLVPDSTTLEPEGFEGECTGYIGFYYPSTIPTGNTCPFGDVVTATAVTPINSIGDQCLPNLGGAPGTLKCTAHSNPATCYLRVTGDPDCETGPWSTINP